jgi:hypothetical protein
MCELTPDADGAGLTCAPPSRLWRLWNWLTHLWAWFWGL